MTAVTDYDIEWMFDAERTLLDCNSCGRSSENYAVWRVFGTPLCYFCMADRRDKQGDGTGN